MAAIMLQAIASIAVVVFLFLAISIDGSIYKMDEQSKPQVVSLFLLCPLWHYPIDSL